MGWRPRNRVDRHRYWRPNRSQVPRVERRQVGLRRSGPRAELRHDQGSHARHRGVPQLEGCYNLFEGWNQDGTFKSYLFKKWCNIVIPGTYISPVRNFSSYMQRLAYRMLSFRAFPMSYLLLKVNSRFFT